MTEKIVYRRVPLSDTPNFRDLGGYSTENGGVTRFGVFYRSACPNSLSSFDVELLAKLNVTIAVDLRGGGNADETQTGFVADGITIRNLAIGGGDAPRYAVDVPESYMQIVSHPNVANVFNTLAEAQGAAVFHCFAGKDRTGTVAALLLMLAGVSDTDIVADYALTYPYFLKRLREDFHRTDCEKDVFIPHPEHMESFLRLFRAKYGNVRKYFLSIGVSEQQLDRIIGKFVIDV